LPAKWFLNPINNGTNGFVITLDFIKDIQFKY